MDPAFNPIRIDDLGYYDFHMDFLQDNILYNNSSFNGSIYGLSKVIPLETGSIHLSLRSAGMELSG